MITSVVWRLNQLWVYELTCVFDLYTQALLYWVRWSSESEVDSWFDSVFGRCNFQFDSLMFIVWFVSCSYYIFNYTGFETLKNCSKYLMNTEMLSNLCCWLFNCLVSYKALCFPFLPIICFTPQSSCWCYCTNCTINLKVEKLLLLQKSTWFVLSAKLVRCSGMTSSIMFIHRALMNDIYYFTQHSWQPVWSNVRVDTYFNSIVDWRFNWGCTEKKEREKNFWNNNPHKM